MDGGPGASNAASGAAASSSAAPGAGAGSALPGGANVGAVDDEDNGGRGHGLEEREEMRSAHRSLKMLRGLCREYHLGFSMPPGTFATVAHGKSGKSASAWRERDDRDAASSSSSDFSSEDDDTYHAPWEEVQDLLETVKPGQRVKELKEINTAMSASAEKAETELKELERLAKAKEEELGDDAAEEAVDAPRARMQTVMTDVSEVMEEERRKDAKKYPLLEFNAAELPFAQALRRCAAIVPELKRRAQEKREAAEAAARAEQSRLEAELLEQQQSDSSSESGGDDAELAREVNRKMKSFGHLPRDADPDLAKVLSLQKQEISALTQRIMAAELEVQVKKLAQEYIEGKVNPGELIDAELLQAAVATAQDMKSTLVAKKRAEMERQHQEEAADSNFPAEEEVRERIEMTKKLEHQVESLTVKLKTMQELDEKAMKEAQKQRDADEAFARRTSELSAEFARAISGNRGDTKEKEKQTVPALDFPLDSSPEVHAKLLEEVSSLEEENQHEERRIEQFEMLVRNVEATLKVMEETKTIFLEQIAQERPQLLSAIDLDDGDEEEGSSEASEGENDEDEDFDEDDRISELITEEKWLRSQLKEAQEALEEVDLEELDEGYSLLTHDSRSSVVASPLAADKGDSELQDPFVNDIKELVARIERASKRAKKAARASTVQEEKEEKDGSDSSESESEASRDSQHEDLKDDGLTSEQALEQLRSLPHRELRDLLQTRQDNQRLLEKLTRDQAEFERLRQQVGVPQALMKPWTTPVDPETLPAGISPELVHDVQRKVRELNALRKRWWSDRQDPMTTVRRTLAVTDLPDDPEADDEPPQSVQASLFERIHASMMLM
eukprot:TRINITY_DN21158_c0_g1_i2.p1 TRINITY_DN21158_c0_g1~~TRINITY_DN21158_c0_g1_i2.p1  ORF type:complete len:846 (+),score=270.27 TRINITY_DN21158_c0_g1_i2:165-2702(+)